MKQRLKKKYSLARICRGSISIFLSIILTGVFSLAALIVEGGRYRVASQVLDEAAITAGLSSLASYDSTLQKRFGLYAVKTDTEQDNTAGSFLEKNSDSDQDGLSKLYDLTNTSSQWKYDLGNFSVLERQILEYEKYRAPLELTEELIDIDKLLEKLEEAIQKLIPGLEQMLNICNAALDLLEGLKSLYSLYRAVQELEASTRAGMPGLGNLLNDAGTIGWEAIEGLFTNKTWDYADPSYYKAYNALNTAINDKVSYMASNPEPPAPTGDRPTVNETNGAKGNQLSAYEAALRCALDNDYFGSSGLKNGSEKIDELKDVLKDHKDELSFLNKDNTRTEFVTLLAEKLAGFYGIDPLSTSSSEDDVEEICDQTMNLAHDYTRTYDTEKGKQEQWDRAKAAYDAYQEAIRVKTEAIDSAKTDVINALDKISSELVSYQKKFKACVDAITKASTAVKTIQENAANLGNKHNSDEDAPDSDWTTPDLNQIDGIFDTLITMLNDSVLAQADNGIQFIANQKTALAEVTGENVDQNFGTLASHQYLGTGNLTAAGISDGGYYYNKTELTLYLADIAGLKILSSVDKLKEVADCFLQITQAFSLVPYVFAPTLCSNLSSSTTSLLPSKVGGSSEPASETDLAAISAYLQEAKTMLGSLYSGDIGQVDPANTGYEGSLEEELSERVSRIAENLQNLSGSWLDILNPSAFLLDLLVNLVFHIGEIIQVIGDLVFVVQHIGTLLQMIPAQLGESFLVNQYAISNFSNRVDTVKCETTSLLRPAPSEDTQTFYQANVEYILGGKYSEIENQSLAFGKIMALRMLNNAVLILMDEDWMELISACNVFAPIVFIVLLYIESNIDMNLLLRLQLKIPMIKSKLVFSVDSITTITEDYVEILEDDDYYYYWSQHSETTIGEIGLGGGGSEHLDIIGDDVDILTDDNASKLSRFYAGKEISEKTKALLESLEDGYFKVKYKDYLFLFLMLMPNRLKIHRMADLIQMEARLTDKRAGKTPKVLSDYHTYVRVEANGFLNSLLPVISIGKDGINNAGIPVSTVKFVGY